MLAKLSFQIFQRKFSALPFSWQRMIQKMASFTKITSWRNFSIHKSLLASLAEPLPPKPTHAHDENSFLMWKKVFFFVCLPVILLSGINVMMKEEELRPEFKKYPHLRIRNKPFPWGDGNKSLFHNPHRNALPDGYEDEIGKH